MCKKIIHIFKKLIVYLKEKKVGWLCMGKINITIHNPNTNEENFKLASYLFMANNLQNAIALVEETFHNTEEADRQVEIA